MTENVRTADQRRPAGFWPRYRSFARRVLYPLAVIAVIAGVIWWLQYREDGAYYSPTGEKYGPTDLPAALVPAGADVGIAEGDLAPDFLLEELDTGDLRLSDFRGRAVVLNFWATWCEPCRKEMPQFVDAYERLKDQGLVVLAVNLQEGKDIVRPFAEKRGMTFPIAVDRDGEVGDRYRLLGLPTTYFIDREGIIRGVFIGPFIEEQRGTSVQAPIGEDELARRIAEILVAPTTPAAP